MEGEVDNWLHAPCEECTRHSALLVDTIWQARHRIARSAFLKVRIRTFIMSNNTKLFLKGPLMG